MSSLRARLLARTHPVPSPSATGSAAGVEPPHGPAGLELEPMVDPRLLRALRAERSPPAVGDGLAEDGAPWETAGDESPAAGSSGLFEPSRAPVPASAAARALAAVGGRRPDDPSAYPWRAICHLAIRAGDGSEIEGTGWLAAPRLVVTAGHCVFQPFRGGWARSIVVSPGRDGADSPYGTFEVRRSGLRCVKGWTRRKDPEFDYGGIVVPSSANLTAPGDRVGYLGFGAPSVVDLFQALLNLAGYPDGAQAGTLWWHPQTVVSVNGGTLRYGIDTQGGQSGSPLWRRVDAGPQVVGIHSGERTSGGQAVRIDRGVYENLLRWQREAS